VREEEVAGRQKKYGLVTTTALVVASMVGTGVFTTTGLLTKDVPSAAGILICWIVAGLAALCGALAYAELGVAFGKSGGEYYFLSRLVHPAVGFVSAFVSLVVGFAAPLAAIALAFGAYLKIFVDIDPRLSGGVLLVVLSALNAWRVTAGARFQDVFTIGKVLLVVCFIVLGLPHGDFSRLAFDAELGGVILSPGFAIGLIWVSFAYTGWSAGAYVAGEVEDVTRTLPRALVFGTLLVTVLYVALNAVFLSAAPLDQLAGKVEVAHEAAKHLFGARGANVTSAIVGIGLIATVGALCVTGPRIYEAVGRDIKPLRFLAVRREGGGPIYASVAQAALALVMMLSARFEDLLIYTGFTLSIFGGLAVGCVFLLRRRDDIESPYRMWGYPVTPLLYIALTLWMIIAGIIERPATAAFGGATLVVGYVLYLVTKGDD
jgi:APA family basic amino acid/polyamine antiporter